MLSDFAFSPAKCVPPPCALHFGLHLWAKHFYHFSSGKQDSFPLLFTPKLFLLLFGIFGASKHIDYRSTTPEQCVSITLGLKVPHLSYSEDALDKRQLHLLY